MGAQVVASVEKHGAAMRRTEVLLAVTVIFGLCVQGRLPLFKLGVVKVG